MAFKTIALLPTGGGKTVIYVVAALLRKGITIVIEPPKSLMEEQVKSLQSKILLLSLSMIT